MNYLNAWHKFDDGKTIGQLGSENGLILQDDENPIGARITLEKGGSIAPYSITCGIYGWMFHTRFIGTETEAFQDFNLMKAELAKILDIMWNENDDKEILAKIICDQIENFVNRFP